MRFLLSAIFVLRFYGVIGQETWCGKNYKKGTPIIDPGGEYKIPLTSNTPLFRFRCSPAIQPYVEDSEVFGTILIDTEIVYDHLSDTWEIDAAFHKSTQFLVTFGIGAREIGRGVVGLGLNKPVDFPLALNPRHEPYEVVCTARPLLHSSTFETTTKLQYLPPNPYGGSIVKRDLSNGGLLVRGRHGHFEPLIPFGFYTSFDNYLAKNFSIMDEAKAKGYNLMHPVPTFGNVTLLDEVLDYMERVGLWLMYDMRWSYKNHTLMTEEVNRIKKRKNLLLWYTADEPDGWVDPTDGPGSAARLIYELDGYHPVSLVLNCENFYFREYTQDSDIILHDTYTVGINATWSIVYDTPCTQNYGDCGCDNCIGDGFADVARRIDLYRKRLYWEGRTGVPIWSVNQAFGEQSFWQRYPTGPEFIVQSVMSFNHGALGIVPWIEPSTSDIVAASEVIAKAIPSITPFLHPLYHSVIFHVPKNVPSGIDIGVWESGIWTRRRKLMLASNLGHESISIDLSILDCSVDEVLFAVDGQLSHNSVVLEPLGSIGIILRVD